jgi:hypothetical protein
MPMQVLTIPATAHGMQFSATGCFVSLSQELTSLTHAATGTDSEGEHLSVWMAMPVGRQILLAAGMIGDALADCDLSRLPTERVRDLSLRDLLGVGTVAAQAETRRLRFAQGYLRRPVEAARYQLLGERLDEAFSFASSSPPII